MLRAKYLLPLFVITLLLLSGCNPNEEVTETNKDDQNTINDPINRPPNPDDPTPNPPQTRLRLVEIKGRDLSKDELKNSILPYNKLFFPVAPLNKNFKSKKCQNNTEKCVVNRQIPFAFNLDVLKGESPKDIVIKDMIIEMGLVSVGQNYRTEQFCFLELKTCSGNAITRHPTLGIPWFIKTFAWDSTFWKKGHDQTMLTKTFHETLEKGKVADGHYVVEKGQFSMKNLFLLSSDNLKEYVFLKDNIRFMVSDDTFVVDPVLKVYIEDKLPTENDHIAPNAPARIIDQSQVYADVMESDWPILNDELLE